MAGLDESGSAVIPLQWECVIRLRRQHTIEQVSDRAAKAGINSQPASTAIIELAISRRIGSVPRKQEAHQKIG
jgi:hypothetical protein